MGLHTKTEKCKNVAYIGELPSIISKRLRKINDDEDYVFSKLSIKESLTMNKILEQEYDAINRDINNWTIPEEEEGDELYSGKLSPIILMNKLDYDIVVFLQEVEFNKFTLFSDKKMYAEKFLEDFNISTNIKDTDIISYIS